MLRRLKKTLIGILRVSISLLLIGYLIWKATSGTNGVNAFDNLRDQPKNWWLFGAALAVTTTATLLTFVRWWYLVRALDVPFKFGNAIRISFWGFLFNLAPLGIVGGDLVKAIMLAHDHKEYRAKALASVLFDRVVGLYLLFVVGTIGILFTGFWQTEIKELRNVCYLTFLITAVGTAGLAFVLAPGKTIERILLLPRKIPKIGGKIESLILAVRMYRHRPTVLLISSLMSLSVHCLLSVAIFLIADGLPGDVLSLGMHFVIWPLSSVMGVLPLPIGPFEFVIEYLYTHVPQAGIVIVAGQGLVVALVFRLINLMVAAMGVYYYFGNRSEVKDAMHETEKLPLDDISNGELTP